MGLLYRIFPRLSALRGNGWVDDFPQRDTIARSRESPPIIQTSLFTTSIDEIVPTVLMIRLFTTRQHAPFSALSMFTLSSVDSDDGAFLANFGCWDLEMESRSLLDCCWIVQFAWRISVPIPGRERLSICNLLMYLGHPLSETTCAWYFQVIAGPGQNRETTRFESRSIDMTSPMLVEW